MPTALEEPPVEVAPPEPPPVPSAVDSVITPPAASPARRTIRIGTGALFAAASGAIASGVAVFNLNGPFALGRSLMAAGSLLFVITALVAAFRFLRAFVGAFRGENGVGPVMANLAWGLCGAWLAAVTTFGFTRGRQLRRFGRVLLPRLGEDTRWTDAALDAVDAADAPAGLADQWRENGRTEHASVAAFARLTLDLLALGAPPHLVADGNRDALDEIRHAELCFGIARALDGRAVGPAPFPEARRVSTLPRIRSVALARLAVDSLVDGALHEGVSARVIAQLARRCQVPAIRAALKEIAADEGRHAAHGWAVVEWCLEEGGRPVADALLGALRVLPACAKTSLPEAAEGGAWERWGIHGAALEADEYAAGRAHLVARVRARLGRESAAA